MKQRLVQLIAQTELQVTEQQLDQLIGYVELLHKWNKAYNLTSVRDPNEMLVKHIMDSIVVSQYLDGASYIDVGTGPGLPGIPLAIMCPDKSFTLLDSLGKRIRFIRQVIHELKITNVTPVQSRVEEFEAGDGFDAVLSRAFASMADMVNWCHHLPKSGGHFLALKGQYNEQEAAELPEWCSVIEVKSLQVPDLEGERHLVVLTAKD
ncbi:MULTISPECIES: 16S rRNA (guanine(527)-N(7))-methyltransferase RsmG [unclassified Photobacterium]|uniref:16S rRNA (guanine(527)-N(7))-methyltransferase RsmG n=1 Tax=unclassified Photobacterium TaxID=2628852 RepID=UPI000D176065|nr:MULTISPECIES: 16S rRNA (guanine(527)-N(7))-methyltransferase RsmG [unclassified Photobacterium]PSV35031.1 16S rRNA (guanine(527)-N(7))-methyltransferase RsmG [Photobacterium sp. GB-210]PSV41731.1 16S rRNA (guanine(527)-N(7))-methyltransferase RsmG [Photobacterium sp. GB-36]